MECIFCKIVKGEVPAIKILEDDLNLAFLDIKPRSPGHTLVIPKKHYEKLEDMPEEEVKELMGFIHKLIKVVPKVVGAQGFNLGINNGKVAGQEIMHTHFNIIPRFENDNGTSIQEIVKIEVKEDLNSIGKKIKEAFTSNQKENKEDKSFEREWQEFNLEIQDDVPDLSEVRKE